MGESYCIPVPATTLPRTCKSLETGNLYYSVSSFGSQNSLSRGSIKINGRGTWEDGGAVITSDPSKPFNAIDPNLIHVVTKIYLNFGSSWQTFTGSSTQPTRSTQRRSVQIASRPTER
ncbi:Glycosyl hydrolase, five-bladed beta-propellor domain [Phytophthora cactorum]|nr:Glycosyl hydrolase, five-bladed beta-propellor domain [Phytophthora cactorum]